MRWGRLDYAQIDDDSKHPIILPYKHHTNDIIICYYHIIVGHMGQESVLSSLRQEFWIIKGRSAVRRVIKYCIDCQRRKAKLLDQYMASLPQDRITHDKPAFTYVCTDFHPTGESEKITLQVLWMYLYMFNNTRSSN